MTMMQHPTFVAFSTIVRKEVVRFFRIWPQTILPSAITMTLYFVIFGNLIGARIGDMEGFTYMQYIVPGLIMMSVITNAYANVSSSFYGAKFGSSIQEMLVAPIPNYVILLGYVVGGVLRGMVVAVVVTGIALFFTHLKMHNIFIMVSIVLLSALLFSLAGFLNGVFAKKFDDVSLVPTFVLTPLTYLGGVFYSIKLLPVFWQQISKANPILYLVNGFRDGILGVSDVNIVTAFVMVITFVILTTVACLYLLKKGWGLRE